MADGVGDVAERTCDTATRTASMAFRRWRRWPRWIGYAAAAWSLVYGVLGLYWALGGAGFPFGTENDPDAALSVLGGVQAETSAPIILIGTPFGWPPGVSILYALTRWA